MSKLNSYWNWDSDSMVSRLVIEKKRGKLTLQEIEEHLRYDSCYQGHWAIILNCSESTCGGSGWFDDIEPKGDVAHLYQLGEGEQCPVCNHMLPPEYCPECGKLLREKSGKED